MEDADYIKNKLDDEEKELIALYKENSIEASAANYIEFKDYIYDEKDNKIIGIKAFDKIGNKSFDIFSKVVVNCTGIFCDDNFNENDKLKKQMIKASKGTHLVFKDLNLKESIMIPKTSDGRVLFILPYGKYFLAGTTDAEDKKNLHPDVLEHEENLIGLYSPNSSGSSSFSKLTSHKMDHDRILSIAKNELERVENNAPSASASTSCSMPQPGQPRV